MRDEWLEIELSGIKTHEAKKRRELIQEIKDYFGEYDARIILKIALYFKRPQTYSHLRKEILAQLRQS